MDNQPLTEDEFLFSRYEFDCDDSNRSSRMGRLQLRLHVWAITAYGWEPAWHYTAGIAEELMELEEAEELHRARLIQDSRDLVLDACVDAINFGIQLSTSQRLDAQTLWFAAMERNVRDCLPMSPMRIAGKLSQIALKSDLGVRGLVNTPEGRVLIRRRYAEWIFQLFVLCRSKIDRHGYEPIGLLEEKADEITKRVPKLLPALKF
jgi:hypothetical protein